MQSQQMIYNNSLLVKNSDNKKRDSIILLLFTIISSLGMLIPYNSILKLLYQMIVFCCLIFFVFKKPNIVLPVIFLTTIAPVRSYAGVFSKELFFIVFDNEDFIAIMLLVIVLLKLIIDKSIRTKYLSLLYIFVILLCLSYFYTDNYTRSIYYTSSFWSIVLTYSIVPLFIKNENDFNMLLKGFLFAFIQNAVLVLIKFTSTGMAIDFDALLNRNYYSLYIVIITIASLVYLLKNPQESLFLKLITVISLIPNCLFLLLLSSRSSFIILIVSLFLLFILMKKSIKVILPMTVVFIFLLYFINNFNVTEVLFNRFEQEDVSSANGRADILVAMLDNFSVRPLLQKLFGTGYFSIFVDTYGGLFGTHNSFLSCLMHYGILGLMCFASIFLIILIKIFRNKKFKFYIVVVLTMFIYCFIAEPHIKTEFIFLFVGLLSMRNNFNYNVRKMAV